MTGKPPVTRCASGWISNGIHSDRPRCSRRRAQAGGKASFPPPKLDARRYNRAGQIARDVCNHCFPMRSPMNDAAIQAERERLFAEHEALIQCPNEPMRESNGWFRRYRYQIG